MFIIQALDHEEGSGARWFDLKNCEFESREDAKKHLRAFRLEWDDRYYENMYSYRIVEKGSALYYSQPTDKGEY